MNDSTNALGMTLLNGVKAYPYGMQQNSVPQ